MRLSDIFKRKKKTKVPIPSYCDSEEMFVDLYKQIVETHLCYDTMLSLLVRTNIIALQEYHETRDAIRKSQTYAKIYEFLSSMQKSPTSLDDDHISDDDDDLEELYAVINGIANEIKKENMEYE